MLQDEVRCHLMEYDIFYAFLLRNSFGYGRIYALKHNAQAEVPRCSYAMSRGVQFSVNTDTKQQVPNIATSTAATITTTSEELAAPSSDHSLLRKQHEARSDPNTLTPPGSPTKATSLHKEHSVHKLYKSARSSFGGGLEPRRDPTPIDFPLRRTPSLMIPAQDWEVRPGSSGVGGGGGLDVAGIGVRVGGGVGEKDMQASVIPLW